MEKRLLGCTASETAAMTKKELPEGVIFWKKHISWNSEAMRGAICS